MDHVLQENDFLTRSILIYLAWRWPRDVCRAARVCRRWRQLCSSPEIWNNMTIELATAESSMSLLHHSPPGTLESLGGIVFRGKTNLDFLGVLTRCRSLRLLDVAWMWGTTEYEETVPFLSRVIMASKELLKSLKIRSYPFDDVLLGALRECPRLESFELYSIDRFSDFIAFIGSAKCISRLRSVDLNAPFWETPGTVYRLASEAVRFLSSSLVHVSITNTVPMDIFRQITADCSHLTSVDFSDLPMGVSTAGVIALLPRTLQSLAIPRLLDDEAATHLSEFHSLTALSASAVTAPVLASLPSLASLRLDMVDASTDDDSVSMAISGLTRLQVLLTNNCTFSRESLHSVLSSCTRLRFLDVMQLEPEVLDDTSLRLICNLKFLEALAISPHSESRLDFVINRRIREVILGALTEPAVLPQLVEIMFEEMDGPEMIRDCPTRHGVRFRIGVLNTKLFGSWDPLPSLVPEEIFSMI